MLHLFARIRKGQEPVLVQAFRPEAAVGFRTVKQMSVYGHAHVRPILSEDAIASARSQQRRARLAHRQSRQEMFDTLQALRQQGLTYNGNRVGRYLFYDIKNRGSTGSRSNLKRLLKVGVKSKTLNSSSRLRRGMFQNPSAILTRDI